MSIITKKSLVAAGILSALTAGNAMAANVPAGVQLAEKQIQRCSFLLGLGKIGHGVQTGFQQMPLELVVGIEATRPVMLINNQGFSAKAGGADTSRQTREASTNDDELVIRHGAWLWW